MMSSPNDWHQLVSMELSVQLGNFFSGKECQTFAAPFDVRLFPEDDESDDIVVQPDLMVICDKAKWQGVGHCKGAPDLVIEILSDSTKSKDLVQKLDLYKNAGVREYWIVGSDAVRLWQFQPDFVEVDCDFKVSRDVTSLIFPDLVLRL